MSYELRFGYSDFIGAIYKNKETAIYFAIDYIVSVLYDMEWEYYDEDLEDYKKIFYYTIVDLIKNKQYNEAIQTFNNTEFIVDNNKSFAIYQTNDDPQEDSESDFIIHKKYVELANTFRKQIAFK